LVPKNDKRVGICISIDFTAVLLSELLELHYKMKAVYIKYKVRVFSDVECNNTKELLSRQRAFIL